ILTARFTLPSVIKQPEASSSAKNSYACKVQETANGCRGGPGCETRRTFAVVAERRFPGNGGIDEGRSTRGVRWDKTQEPAHEKAQSLTRICAQSWTEGSRLIFGPTAP